MNKLKLTDKLLLKHMLKTLGSKTLCRNDWIIASQIGHQKFDSLLKCLLAKGYIERISRGIYRVTPEGKKWLELNLLEN